MIALLILLTILLGALGIHQTFYRKRAEFRDRLRVRIKELRRSGAAKPAGEPNVFRSEDKIAAPLLGSRWGQAVARLIERADVNLRVPDVLLMSLLLFLLSGSLSWFWRGSVIVSVALSLLFGGAPFGYLYVVSKRRMEQFLEQLPDALDLMTRALRAGHAFGGALHAVATEMPDPVAKEFGKTFDELNLGVDMKSSLEHLIERVPLLDLRLCVTAILIHHEIGGNLTDILGNVSNVIRERFRILGQVKVYTAQGRLTGWIIGLLPFVIALFMYMFSPEYLEVLVTHPWGQMLLAVGLVLELIGLLMIRKIISIRV